eukprot:Skav218934  [mRNA]  locus=scaffold678:127045:128884:+ [translate_table: standard]
MLVQLHSIRNDSKRKAQTQTALSSRSISWSSTFLWKVVMILNSICWGSTFIGTKAAIDALQDAAVPNAGAVFGVCRFALAAFPLLPWLGRSTSLESAALSALVGLIWGTSYACTFLSYTLGTTGAKAAFITSLQSLVVAACTSIVARRLQLGTIFSALLAVLGVACIELNGATATLGDVVCLVAPVGVGLGWYVLEKAMKKYPEDFLPSVVIQFSVFTVIFTLWLLKDLEDGQGWALIQEMPRLFATPKLLCPLFCCSMFGNLVTMLSANVACRYLPVSDVSLIVTTEPLFAAIAAVCFLGETFSLGDYLGDILRLQLSACHGWPLPSGSPVPGGFFIMAALLCNESGPYS